MLAIFLQTLPFFAIIALGYASGRTGFFSEEATAYLTRFVFYFALSALLFRFSSNLSLSEVFDWSFVLAYLCITGSRDGRIHIGVLKTVALGLLKNPMIVSIVLGLTVSAFALPIPRPLNEFVTLLGGAATPGALFAIGASLASKSAERLSVALWLSTCKLALHPIAVAIFALLVFDVEPYAAGVMIAAASLPVAGNVYMLAQHYRVAPARVSAAILVSTALSILTVSAVIAWVGHLL